MCQWPRSKGARDRTGCGSGRRRTSCTLRASCSRGSRARRGGCSRGSGVGPPWIGARKVQAPLLRQSSFPVCYWAKSPFRATHECCDARARPGAIPDKVAGDDNVPTSSVMYEREVSRTEGHSLLHIERLPSLPTVVCTTPDGLHTSTRMRADARVGGERRHNASDVSRSQTPRHAHPFPTSRVSTGRTAMQLCGRRPHGCGIKGRLSCDAA